MPGRKLIFFLFLTTSLFAQFDTSTVAIARKVRVHVAFADGSRCDASTHVSLANSSGTINDGVANDACLVELSNIPAGSYTVMVSQAQMLISESDKVLVDSSQTNDIEVKVRRIGDADGKEGMPGRSTVSAIDMQAPAPAKKEFSKGMDLIHKKDWSRAADKLNHAIALYPKFAVAYDALGVAYAALGQLPQARASLQHAITLNDHYAPAYVSLARLNITASDFAAAEPLLEKAYSLNPLDAATVVLLAYSEYMNQHLEQSLANCRRAHAMPQSQHATVHWVAARILERRHQSDAALTELRFFLHEEQTGMRADAARKEIAALQSGTMVRSEAQSSLR